MGESHMIVGGKGERACEEELLTTDD